jgi:hypothetical protein
MEEVVSKVVINYEDRIVKIKILNMYCIVVIMANNHKEVVDTR